MKKIIAQNKEHLLTLIEQEMKQHGNQCDFNHIDVSNVKDMSYLFAHLQFNGNISKWDVSNVTDMSYMFFKSKFNGDISKWDVSNVNHMSYMFYQSEFNQDLSDWKPLSLKNKEYIFYNSILEKNKKLPYWVDIEYEFMKSAINTYELQKKLNHELKSKEKNKKISLKI